MDLGSPFSLGFNGFNIIMSLILIGLFVWFCVANYPKIAKMLKEQLARSLKRKADADSRQPLYEVFYGFNHDTVESWLRTIKSQSSKKQEKAFERLTEYLREPPKELGLISKEVVKAVILFDHEETYEVLEQLARKTREKWGQYKALNSFYDDAIVGLINIDPRPARDFLVAEISRAHNIMDSDSLKQSIVRALAELPNPRSFAEVLRKITQDPRNSLSISTLGIDLLEEKEPELAFQLIKNTIKDMCQVAEHENFEFFDYCFSRLLAALAEEEDLELLEIIKLPLNHASLAKPAVRRISQIISDRSYDIDSEFLLELLYKINPQELKVFKKALIQRYNLSEEEKSIITETNQLAKINEKNIMPEEVLCVDKEQVKHNIPWSLRDDYEKLELAVNKKFSKPGMRVIIGDAELEKYFLIKNIVGKHSQRKLIFINTKQLIQSPTLVDELDTFIGENRPCLIYMTDIFPYLKALQNNPNKRILKFEKTLKKYFNDSRVSIFASLARDLVDLKDNDPDVYDLLKDIPNKTFEQKITIGALSSRQKQKIFNHYELKVEEFREIDSECFDEILLETEDFSNLNYARLLLEYMKASLLSHGGLISVRTYQNCLEQLKEDKELV